jgi:hypothetical protein
VGSSEKNILNWLKYEVSSLLPFMNSIDYKVSFGKTARTLLYEDSNGTVRFGFDVNPSQEKSKEKWTIELECPSNEYERIASIKNRQLWVAEQKRVDIAIERTKQYLISCGYLVKI